MSFIKKNTYSIDKRTSFGKAFIILRPIITGPSPVLVSADAFVSFSVWPHAHEGTYSAGIKSEDYGGYGLVYQFPIKQEEILPEFTKVGTVISKLSKVRSLQIEPSLYIED